MRSLILNNINVLKSYSLYESREVLEAHIVLNINPKITEQNFLQKFSYPHRLHKALNILVFLSDEDSSKRDELSSIGSCHIADDQIINQIKKGKVLFDYCVASPSSMKILSPLAKILGPRGLMPSAKLGTLDVNVSNAVRRLNEGQFSLRNDRYGIIHAPLGYLNNSCSHLTENLVSLVDFINSKKPLTAKGGYIKSISLSTTEGPSFHIEHTK